MPRQGDNPVLKEAKGRLEAALAEALKGPAALQKRYEAFTYLLADASDEEWLSEYQAAEHELEEYKDAIQHMQQAIRDVETTSYDSELFGLLKVQVRGVSQSVSQSLTHSLSRPLTYSLAQSVSHSGTQSVTQVFSQLVS